MRQTYVSFAIHASRVSLVQAETNDSVSLQLFRKECDLENLSTETIEVNYDRERNGFSAVDAQLSVAKHLWNILGNVAVDENGADGLIDEAFIHFEKGEPVYNIWSWFEVVFDISVATDLMGS